MKKTAKRHRGAESTDIHASMLKAYDLLNAGEYAEAINVLGPYEKDYPFSDSLVCGRYDSLVAYAYSQVQKHIEAEKVIDRALAQSPGNADILFTKTFIKLTMREYDAAKKAAGSYIKAVDLVRSNTDSYFAGRSHRAQVFNMLGVAERQTGNEENAARYFREALEADQSNHLPFLNLAHLYLRKNLKQKALEVLKKGTETCGQIHELRMLLESVNSKPSVSACMIVKDEEELLPGCLESIRDWVDEIIIVDTGSKDRTIEIAESFGAKVFHQPWEGNFSKHRNFSLEQATSDWLLIIDADERVVSEDIPLLLGVLAQKEHKLLSVNVFNVYGKNEESTTFLPSTRLFRRELNLRYEGIVHNLLKLPENVRITRADIRIKHLGYDLSKEKMAAKIARSRALLEKQLEENPDNAFALFNYAQLLRGDDPESVEGNSELILESAARAVEITDPQNTKERHIHLMCLNQLAWTHLFSGNYDEALRFANTALRIKPDYLDPLLVLGHIYAKKEDYARAEKSYENYIKVQSDYNPSAETENMIISHIDSRVNAYYGLGMIAELREDFSSAKRHYRKTLELDQHYLEANAHLGRLLLKDGNVNEAESLFIRQLDSETESSDGVTGLAHIYMESSRSEKAKSLFENWLDEHPNDQTVISAYARMCHDSGQHEKAEELLSRLSSKGISSESVSRQVADIYFAQGKFSRSADILRQLISKGQVDDPALLNDLGNCHFKMGDLVEAELWYQKATRLAPILPIAYRNLGLTQARLQRIDDAIEPLKTYLQLESDDDEISGLLADMLGQKGEYLEALSIYEQRLSRSPQDVSALLRLSDCYLHMGHSDSAVIGYRRVLSLDPENISAKERLASLTAITGNA